MKRDGRRCWPGFLLCLLWSVAALAQPVAEDPVLTLDRYHPLLPNTTGEPMVKVFRSGRVEIMRPPGFIDPGRHVLQLSTAERDALILSLRDAQRVPELLSRLQFDDGTAHDDEHELVHASDATVSTIRFAPTQPSNDGVPDGRSVSAQPGDGELEAVNMQTLSGIPDQAVPGAASLRQIERTLLEIFSRAGGEQ